MSAQKNEQGQIVSAHELKGRFKPEKPNNPLQPPEWPEHELLSLRKNICRSPPHPDDPYWKTNPIWIGCVQVNSHMGYSSKSEVGNLEIKIKVTSLVLLCQTKILASDQVGKYNVMC